MLKQFLGPFKVPEKLPLYGLYVYYVVHICDFGMLRVKEVRKGLALTVEIEMVTVTVAHTERILNKTSKSLLVLDLGKFVIFS